MYLITYNIRIKKLIEWVKVLTHIYSHKKVI